MSEIVPSVPNNEDEIAAALVALEPTAKQRVMRKLVMAALGAVPWVGSVFNAMQAYKEEDWQLKTDALQKRWLEEHKQKFLLLGRDLAEVTRRLDSVGDEIGQRLESEEYLALVRKAFRIWDQADTEQKREYVRKLIANAGATLAAPDDLVRLFLDWLNNYHEAHFAVIRAIYKDPGITRYAIWEAIHGALPREDSSEADLFKLLITDLSTGHVVRQHRDKNAHGQFLRQPRRRSAGRSDLMKSAFDDEAPYELTELGKKFVHYVFTEIVPKIEQ